MRMILIYKKIDPRSIIDLVDGGVGTLHECVGTNKGSVALEEKICLKKTIEIEFKHRRLIVNGKLITYESDRNCSGHCIHCPVVICR